MPSQRTSDSTVRTLDPAVKASVLQTLHRYPRPVTTAELSHEAHATAAQVRLAIASLIHDDNYPILGTSRGYRFAGSVDELERWSRTYAQRATALTRYALAFQAAADRLSRERPDLMIQLKLL